MNRVWMIVENDPIIRDMLTMLCKLWEVDPLIFENGNQAWRWLDEVERGACQDALPEVALIDIRLQGHQGHEIGQRMRNMDITSGIPLIMTTAYHLSRDDRDEIEDAAHPDHIILKPFPSLDEFRDLIEDTISSSQPTLVIHEHFRYVDTAQVQS